MFATSRLLIRAYESNKSCDLDFMMQLSNNLEVQKMAWVEHIVPRGPKFKETIEGWVIIGDGYVYYSSTILTKR